MTTTTTRRELLERLGLTVAGGFTATALGYAANETINVGCIGTGGRGQFVMKALAGIPGARMTAVCDVWDTNLAAARKIAVHGASTAKDYRTILDNKNIDAVLIAAPDHQHVALLAAACAAGKDVYVEKPLTHTVAEGAAALSAQNDRSRIVQVGMQQRSMPQFLKGYEIIRSGKLGKVHKVRLSWNRNSNRTVRPAYNIDPATVDWKAWLGPVADQPFDEVHFRQWRWFWDFGGGVMTDLMVHFIDIAHWYLGADHPSEALSVGDRYAASWWQTPDTAQTILRYPDQGFQAHFESTFVNSYGGAMIEFMGTDGTLYLDRGRYEIHPEKNSTLEPSEMVLGKGALGADAYDAPDGETLHLSNWLECIRSRKTPRAPVEVGISAASAAHLANRSLREGKIASWDA